MADDVFMEFAFVALVALVAILFTAFGALYSVYAMYMSQVTPEDPFPPMITKDIAILCKIVSYTVVTGAVLAVFCLFWIIDFKFLQIIVALGISGMLTALGASSFLISRKVHYPEQR